MSCLSHRLPLVPSLALLAGSALVVDGRAAETPEPGADGAYADIVEAITDGTVDFQTRLRLELVDQDGIAKEATALALDTTLGYRTGSYRGVSAYLQFEAVQHLIDDFNSTANGRTDYPVVADPEAAEINQVYLDWAIGETTTKARLGRQRLILDNSRHVGNVGWRLNEQTLDALTVTSSDVENLALSASFVTKTNTIRATNVHYDGTLLLNAGYTFADIGTLTGYGYLLDFDEELSTGTDLATFGLRFAGAYKLNDDVKLHYEAELASQSDYADSEDISASYYHLVAGASYKTWTATIGYELLGSDDGTYGFSFPLGTNHKFNGWADKFLATPGTGLQDLYLMAAATFSQVKGLKVAAFYHMFESDEDDIDYGDELDAVVTYQFDDYVTFGGKLALYSADEFATDTNKFWLWTEFGF